ncbi:MAG: hypothetical protein M3R43_07550 [Acidobacteriota bacterium]|nr:hypothetical protein [Acidobacteriota bacterium]
MSTSTTTPLVAHIDTLTKAAGLTIADSASGQDYTGHPTTRFTLALAADPAKTQSLELSEAFDAGNLAYATELATYFAESARRLRNPRPDCYLAMIGLPLSFSKFGWPFHGSTSGADTSLVHGEVNLETGEPSALHAKISASLTQTFAEVVTALEQPFAESFIYNAVRKTMDQGQLELTKSGNRQPVPVTTRYYSTKQNIFIFNDTDAAKRSDFITAKVFWQSGILGGGTPVWIADPRDAQYLNTTIAELKSAAAKLAADGLLKLSDDGDSAAPTPELLSRDARFRAEVEDALTFIKPHFNEDMRGGHTNM